VRSTDHLAPIVIFFALGQIIAWDP
jgi:hypothetical protein